MKASKKFGLMSNEQFADYLYNNPGGASKAFLLRCEGVSTEQPKVEVRTEWKTKVEYKERVVEKVVERVEKVVEKIKVPLWMRRVTGISVMVAMGCMVMMPTGVVKEVVKKERVEVPVEVLKEVVREVEVPVEVIKEVEVVREVPGPVREVEVRVANGYTENKLRGEVERLTVYINHLHEQLARR